MERLSPVWGSSAPFFLQGFANQALNPKNRQGCPVTSFRSLITSVCMALLIAGGSTGLRLLTPDTRESSGLAWCKATCGLHATLSDPLSDSHGDWEAAVLNLPIRQGYVVATDNGRAEWNSKTARWHFWRKTRSWVLRSFERRRRVYHTADFAPGFGGVLRESRAWGLFQRDRRRLQRAGGNQDHVSNEQF